MDWADAEARIVAAGRPRLFFQEQGLAQLKEAIRTTHREKWERLKAAVEAVLEEDPPEYQGIKGDPTRPGTLNDEMLYQRNYGYRVPALALVALLDPDPKYFAAARKWAMKPGEYPLWGAGVFENTGLAAAHTLYGLATAYDWLYGRWSPEDRERLRTILAEHAKIMYEAAEGINDRGWWKDLWKQNHSFIDYGGLGLAATALAGDAPDAGVWFEKVEWAYQHIFDELPDDGSYEEGVPYWGYGIESLVRCASAMRAHFATDFWQTTNLKNGHLFRLYMAGPQLAQIANFGDGLTRDWHAMRTTMYRFAAEYRNPLAQWLAEALPDRQEADPCLYALLWHDPTVPAEIPADQPLWKAFHDTGFAGVRSSWGEEAMTVHLRSGVTNVSHSHFDVNDFLLNAGGEWLLQDYGYGKVGPGYFDRGTIYFSVSTLGHNCLVIGGKDQRNAPDSLGTITHAEERDGLVWLRSDATPVYEGATSVVRELIVVKPHAGTGKWGHVIVRDRARAAQPETFDFMLQPGGEVIPCGDCFEIRGKAARLVGRVLSPSDVTLSLMPGLGEHVNVPAPFSLKLAAPAATEAEFVVVLVPLAEGESYPTVSLEGGVVRVGGDRIVLSANGEDAPHREA
jgi:hypothetical protein